MIKLGNKVKDDITGFKGVVIGRSEYLYDNEKVLIQPEKLQSDGKPAVSEWFGVLRVSLLTEENTLGFKQKE